MRHDIKTVWGVLYKSGVYARKALCLTPGGLYGVCVADRVCLVLPDSVVLAKTAIHRVLEPYLTVVIYKICR